MGEKDEAHLREVNRLYRAIRRDYFTVVEEFAGFHPGHGDRAWSRLCARWDELCRLDLDVASVIWHGLNQVESFFGRHGQPEYSPFEHHLRGWSEVVGVMQKGREANPDAAVETTGELYALGEEAIRHEIEEDTGGTLAAGSDGQ